MKFNEHYNLVGKHAYMSASQYHWLNYSEEKFIQTYKNHLAKQNGTRLHELAAEAISLGVKLPRNKKTLNNYVNDAIGYKMRPEQILYYSPNCFGTADAISFRNNFLRIHDLKTGVTPAHMEQLFIYVALFCLEYDILPSDIKIETRIYQNDEVFRCNPTSEDIVPIMDKIKMFDKMMNNMEE